MSAVGDFISDITGRSAAEASERAGALQAGASQAGVEEQRRQFDITQQQLAPFREAGVGALQQQQALLGLLGPEQQREAFAGFVESPGQKFIREREERSLLRGAAARGGLGGGNVLTALQQQGAGFAQQDIQDQLVRLGALSGTGQKAATNIGQFGAQTAENIANLQQAGAQARATGLLGAQQAGGQFAQQLGGAAIGAGLGATGVIGGGVGGGALLGLLSDRNMKTDINDIDLKACFDAVVSMPLKSWRYLKEAGIDESIHFGPMAQDAPEMIKIPGKEMLNLHDELTMIAGAIQYMKQEGMING